MILHPGHGRALAAPLRLRAREKWVMGVVLAVIAALVLIIVIALASAGRASKHGCVDVTTPSSLGGQEIYECGVRARALCASTGTSTGYTGAAGSAIAGACRKAGLPVGR